MSDFSIPGNCDPCPGKTNAILPVGSATCPKKMSLRDKVAALGLPSSFGRKHELVGQVCGVLRDNRQPKVLLRAKADRISGREDPSSESEAAGGLARRWLRRTLNQSE